VADIGFPDDFEPTPELRKAMTKILQAVETWQKAVTGSGDEGMWYPRIDAVRKAAKNVYDIMSDELVFPGKSQQASYNNAIKLYLDLNDDIQFAKATLPRPDLIDQAESFVQSLADFPSDIIEGVGDIFKKAAASAGDALNGTATEIVKKLWPWALGLALIVVAVEFGPTIVKAVKK
jgi:hypothetical protein